MSYSIRVLWGSAERGREIIKWAMENCPSYDRVYGKIIDPSKHLSLENAYMEMWFDNEQDATLCRLRWT